MSRETTDIDREKADAARIRSALPEPPAAFDHALRKTLEDIRAANTPVVRLRTLVIIMALTLCAAGAALAISGNINLFNFFSKTFSPEYQTVQPGAYDLTRRDVAAYSFGHVDVAIREAAWDGRVLRVLYSVRDRAATAPYTDDMLNEYSKNADGTATYFIMEAAEADGVFSYRGCDYVYINGKSLSMTGYMGVRAGEGNGEVLVAIECDIAERMKSEGKDMALGDSFTVSLPIAVRFDENGRRVNITPEELTFTLSNTNLPGVRRVEPPPAKRFADGELRVTDFTISPIRVYLTAQYVFDADADMARVRQVVDKALDGCRLYPKGEADDALRVFEWGIGAVNVAQETRDLEGGDFLINYTPMPGKRAIVEAAMTFVTRESYPDVFEFSMGGDMTIEIPNRAAQPESRGE